MKIVSKKIIVFILFILLLICAFLGIESTQTHGAILSEETFTDSFDSRESEIGSDWIKKGEVSIKKDFNALRFNVKDYEWGLYLANSKYVSQYNKLSNGFRVEFTVSKYGDRGNWLALAFGNDTPSTEFPYSTCAVVFSNYDTVLFKKIGADLLDSGKRSQEFNIFLGSKSKVVFNFAKTSINYQYNLNLSCTNLDNNSVSTFDFGEVTVNDGYIGFNTDRMQVDILDFAIYEDDNVNPCYYDDFSSSSILYTTSGSSDSAWYANKFLSESTVMIGSIGKLDVSRPSSGVIYSNPYNKNANEDTNLLYSLSATFYIGAMENSDTGFVFGADSNGNNGMFVGIKKTSLISSLVYYSDENNANTLTNFIDQTINLTLSVYKGNIAVISLGEESFEVSIDNEKGYFGVITNGLGVGAYVDDFKYSCSSYVNRNYGDSNNNFNNLLESIIQDEKYYDFYNPSKDWYTGENISLPIKTQKSDDGYLIFTSANDFSCFGPKTKYTDFIVRFDVKFKSVVDDSLIGLSFAKDEITKALTNSSYVGFQNNFGVTDYASNTYSAQSRLRKGNVSTPEGGQDNIFIEGETYTFMFIALNGTMTIHCKNVNQNEEVLSFVRAKFENVDTDGYLAVFGLNASFDLDNLFITNLDYHYFTDSKETKNFETIRYDFAKGSDFNALSYDGKIVNGALDVDSGVSTKKEVGANITRFKFDTLYGTFNFKHGDIQVSIDADTKKINLFGLGMDNTIVLAENFVFENAVFEFRRTYNTFNVAFVSGDRPISAISDNNYIFDVSNVSYDKMQFTASRSAYLSELSIFNLDSNATEENKIYVLSDVRVEMPPKNKAYDPSGQGCNGSINTQSFVFLACLTALVLVFILRKKESK